MHTQPTHQSINAVLYFALNSHMSLKYKKQREKY